MEILLDRLQPDSPYYHRRRYRQPGTPDYSAGAENSFHTRRPPGARFTFGVQGDSHPERLNRMYLPELYARTVENVRRDRPDFYVIQGDDFSVDPVYNRGTISAETVGRLYASQRRVLGPMVNGNHEQAARCLLNGKPDSPPVLAGIARNLYFPNPAPDGFYSADALFRRAAANGASVRTRRVSAGLG